MVQWHCLANRVKIQFPKNILFIMTSAIKSPDGKLFPSDSNTLIVDSFCGLPPVWRWSVGITITLKDGSITYVELRNGNDGMTPEQWAAWTSQPDTYVLQCAAYNLGLTLA